MTDRPFEPDVGLCPDCGSTDIDHALVVNARGFTCVTRMCWQCGWTEEPREIEALA